MNIPFSRTTLPVFILLLFIITLVLLLPGILLPKEPIRIGFVATLTASQAELGVQERDGVLMAIDEINAAGGIHGRPLELIVRDDAGTPEGARTADQDLIDAGVVAIIGHATSAQTLAGLEVTGPAGIILLSPTTSTTQLTGIDDLFFRIVQGLNDRARGLADYAFFHQNITRIAVISETDNAAYVNSYYDAFAEKYSADGGVIVAVANFSSKLQPDFTPFIKTLQTHGAGGLLIIASDADTALIAQRTRQMGWTVPLLTSSWAMTQALIDMGGPAVEGMVLEQTFPLNSQAPGYLEFKNTYVKRFGRIPSFGALCGYESVKILAIALEKTGGSRSGLKEALLGISQYQGLADTISLDAYGDVIRSYSLAVVRNGSYEDIDQALK